MNFSSSSDLAAMGGVVFFSPPDMERVAMAAVPPRVAMAS
jgi:hypothetical protein